MQSLTTLYLSQNPWKKPSGLRLRVISRLKSLTKLDGVLVTEAEATAAMRMAAGARVSQVSLLAHSRTDVTKPRLVPSFFGSFGLFHRLFVCLFVCLFVLAIISSLVRSFDAACGDVIAESRQKASKRGFCFIQGFGSGSGSGCLWQPLPNRWDSYK